jgi:hypothetical protein
MQWARNSGLEALFPDVKHRGRRRALVVGGQQVQPSSRSEPKISIP